MKSPPGRFPNDSRTEASLVYIVSYGLAQIPVITSLRTIIKQKPVKTTKPRTKQDKTNENTFRFTLLREGPGRQAPLA